MRDSNDGRGRLGGRKKGTPNRSRPLKDALRRLSLMYYTSDDPNLVSQFEQDLLEMDPKERALIHERLLRYHTAPMQSISSDLTVAADGESLEQRLARLAAGDKK